MFTPTPPREESAESPPQPSKPDYPDIALPKRSFYSPRTKLLWQALLGGSLLSAVISFILAGLLSIVAGMQSVERLYSLEAFEPFLMTFLRTWIAMLPYFCVLIGGASAVEMLIKRNAKQTQQAAKELVEALQLIAGNLQGGKPAVLSPKKNAVDNPFPNVPTLELAPEPPGQSGR